jgi:hypothetical protein
MSARDLKKIVVGPHATMEFITGMCHALSDEHGDVIFKLSSVNGKPVATFEREVADPAIPLFLRRQSDG